MNGGAPAAGLVLLALVAGGARAQEPERAAAGSPDSVALYGWIVDAASRQRLASAYLVVDGTRARAVTQEGGGFRLTVTAAPTYTIHAGRFGYMDMEFQVDGGLVGEPLILPLEPEPIPVQGIGVTVDRLEELRRDLEERVRLYPGLSRTVDRHAIQRSGSTSALEAVMRHARGLFECVGTPGELCARPRPSSSIQAPVEFERPVRLCVDERRAWGGVSQLRSIPAEQVHRIEAYGLGGRDQVRVYTRLFMVRNSGSDGARLAPMAWGGAPGCL